MTESIVQLHAVCENWETGYRVIFVSTRVHGCASDRTKVPGVWRVCNCRYDTEFNACREPREATRSRRCRREVTPVVTLVRRVFPGRRIREIPGVIVHFGQLWLPDVEPAARDVDIVV